MNIDLRVIERQANHYDVTRAIANVLHSPQFLKACNISQKRPANFLVNLSPDKVANSIRNGGTGTLTLPYPQLGTRFLQYIRRKKIKFKVMDKPIFLSPSDSTPHKKVIYTLRMVPYQDPDLVEKKEEIIKSLTGQICIRILQFGIICRKPGGAIFSSEWEQDFTERGDARLSFEYEHKLLRVKTGGHTETVSRSVVITFANLKRSYIGWDMGSPFILLHIITPAALESESMHRSETGNARTDRQHVKGRVGYFDGGHKRVAPYAHQLRLVVKEPSHLRLFVDMCATAGIPIPVQVSDNFIEASRLEIFSETNLVKIRKWLKELDWTVAFQCEALLCNLRVNATELLDLRPQIELLAQKGPDYASDALRHFHTVMSSLDRSDDLGAAFTRAVAEYDQLLVDRRTPLASAFFNARHVSFTPTAVRLEGPYTHQSNTVLREYINYQEYFIRADFRDEDRLQYRWDREVDGSTFVRERVGEILKTGFSIAGRHFDFLAYSQSQLRSHSVFFVAPFEHPQKGKVTASTIRDELGVFNNIIQLPALYAARISQAFSGTEASIRLRKEQWKEIDDVLHNERNFTDGVGTISSQLATIIWESLCEQRQRTSSAPFTPVAFQIRFGGYKGMVVVDPRLTGIRMCLRPSMKKFETRDVENIPLEIVRAFEYPSRMYLNRPLIQIMEDLGIPRQTFMELQQAAVSHVRTARNSLANFANLLDSHSLGKAFSLSYVLRSLEKIGCELDHKVPSRKVANSFIRGLVDTAIVSVLRDIKHKARIPVPQSWNLVGVADESGLLRPGDIYACVWEQGKEEPIFLEGPVVISRSPTIHAGDVQLVWAIGKPPRGSIFADEPLPNVVVFSCRGKRDVPSCLGGGDLDGDLYCVCTYDPLLLDPKDCHTPGDYPPTRRKDIGRPSTMDDVADFVVDYINNDVVGLLSTNHLILSDQSVYGTRDHACLYLAELCSKAVDFPKSGVPVNLEDTPRFLIPNKPDWKSDEVINPRRTDYYESTRAIGYLFRAIKLEENVHELSLDLDTSDLMDKPKMPPDAQKLDSISVTVGSIVKPYLRSSPAQDFSSEIQDLFSRYSMELKYMCVTHTLSYDPDVRLREEEIVVGAILAKCAQSRWRADRTEQMRINADRLVSMVNAELQDVCPFSRLAKAWAAWEHSQANWREFGHYSFGLIALATTFRVLEEIEDIPQVTT